MPASSTQRWMATFSTLADPAVPARQGWLVSNRCMAIDARSGSSTAASVGTAGLGFAAADSTPSLPPAAGFAPGRGEAASEILSASRGRVGGSRWLQNSAMQATSVATSRPVRIIP